MKDIDIFLLDLYESPGLYGLFSVPGLEKHVLLMYAAHLIAVNKGKPLVFTLELSKEQWRDQMEKGRLSTDGITIIDTPSPSPDTIRMYIKNHSPSIILIHKMKLMEGLNLASALKKYQQIFRQRSLRQPILAETAVITIQCTEAPRYST